MCWRLVYFRSVQQSSVIQPVDHILQMYWAGKVSFPVIEVLDASYTSCGKMRSANDGSINNLPQPLTPTSFVLMLHSKCLVTHVQTSGVKQVRVSTPPWTHGRRGSGSVHRGSPACGNERLRFIYYTDDLGSRAENKQETFRCYNHGPDHVWSVIKWWLLSDVMDPRYLYIDRGCTMS